MRRFSGDLRKEFYDFDWINRINMMVFLDKQSEIRICVAYILFIPVR